MRGTIDDVNGYGPYGRYARDEIGRSRCKVGFGAVVLEGTAHAGEHLVAFSFDLSESCEFCGISDANRKVMFRRHDPVFHEGETRSS
jgi:hypothetical protein